MMEQLPPWRPDEGEITLPDGTRLWLRLVRPDDARLVRVNFAKATAEDIHQRFFEYLTAMPDALVNRLTQCDVPNELALVAVPLPGHGEPDDAYGVVRLVADEACREAEYAIIIRHDWQGRGLGWALTNAALARARRRGIERVYALVLLDNIRMVKMLREFGFAVESIPQGGGVIRAELRLAPHT